MLTNFDVTLQWLQTHPQWGGFATFLISALESTAIIGTLVPGSITMIAIGALIGTGILPLWTTVLWGIAGAIVGDGISYGLGFYFRDRLPNVWPFSRFPKLLSRGEGFFNTHGGKSVFIGRFVGPMRAIVPVIAGMLHLSPRRFFIASTLSGIGWAPVYMLPGILLGAASIQLPTHIALRYIGMLLIIILFIMALAWLIHTAYDNLEKQCNHFYLAKWQQLSRSHPWLTDCLKFHNPAISQGQLGNALLLITTSIGFLIIASLIYTAGEQTGLNETIHFLCSGIRYTALDRVFIFITYLGEKVVLFPMVLVIFCAFVVNKNWRVASYWLALAFLALGSSYFFKEIIQAVRPEGLIQLPSGYSFPSGHSTLSVALYGFLATLFVDKLPNYRLVIYWVASSVITAVLLSRLYLGMHWFADVVGGVLLGLSCLLLITIAYHRHSSPPIKPLQTLSLLLLSLLISMGVYAQKNFRSDYDNSQPRKSAIVLDNGKMVTIIYY